MYYILNERSKTFETIEMDNLKDCLESIRRIEGTLDDIKVIKVERNSDIFLSGEEASSFITITDGMMITKHRLKIMTLQDIINKYYGETRINVIRARALNFDDETANKCKEWLNINNINLEE